MTASRGKLRRGAQRGRRRKVVAAGEEPDAPESGDFGLHWYILGFSVLLVISLSLVNFLTLPDWSSHKHFSFNFQDPGIDSLRGRAKAATSAIWRRQASAQPPPGDTAWAPSGLRAVADDAGLPHSNGPSRGAASVVGAFSGAAPAPAVAETPGVAAGALPTLSPEANAAANVALFSGEGWLQLQSAVDADELTFGAQIYLSEVSPNVFPPSSDSIKTIAATKISGCTRVSAASDGWALFVNEWGTTNRQLRLSWTDASSSCRELFSKTAIVPYETWVQVGFTLSKSRNQARLFLGPDVVADTVAGVGELSSAGKPAPVTGAAVADRLVQTASTFNLGAHALNGNNYNQIHTFIGYMGQVRLLKATHEDPAIVARILSFRASSLIDDLVQSGLAPASALAVLVEFNGGSADASSSRAFVRNIVDNMGFSQNKVPHDTGTSGVHALPTPITAWSPKLVHPLQAEEKQLQASVAPGPILGHDALRASWPENWVKAHGEQALLASQNEAYPWADAVREAARHAWRGYRTRAMGHDEVRPSSGNSRNWCKLGVTMLDSLSTLWLLGLREDFDDAYKWMEEHPLPSPGSHGKHSMFEITIRALGGLLSAHSLSGRDLFLRYATKLADNLMPAFKTASGIPMAAVDVGTGAAGWHSWVGNAVLAEVGTVQLEMRYLSHATGDPKYAAAGDRAMDVILKAAGGRGLVPIYLSNKANPQFVGAKISLGAMGDSYYEYLLKLWQQSKGESKAKASTNRYKETWRKAMAETMDRLITKTAGGLTFVAESDNNGRRNRMDHLACFVPGMLVHGARMLPADEVDPRWEPTAAEITRTCYEMYKRSPSGVSPEYVNFNLNAGAGKDMTIPHDAPQYLLRPEAAEAIYYMHYYTGDPKYRQWAWEMFSAVNTHCRTRFGHSAIRDVRSQRPQQSDSMESFWLAETVKYFYLTFAPRSVLSMEEFVFNTEAHPLKVWSDSDAKPMLFS